MPIERFATLRYEGIVYLIKRDSPDTKEPYDVYIYDIRNPIKVGTWTNEDGVQFTSDIVKNALVRSRTLEELQENITGSRNA